MCVCWSGSHDRHDEQREARPVVRESQRVLEESQETRSTQPAQEFGRRSGTEQGFASSAQPRIYPGRDSAVGSDVRDVRLSVHCDSKAQVR